MVHVLFKNSCDCSGGATSESDLLRRVQAGSVKLTQAISTGGIQTLQAYQLPIISAWLDVELEGLKSSGARAHSHESSEWYVKRGIEIFGPVNFKSLRLLRGSGGLDPADECFSLVLGGFCYGFDIEAAEPARQHPKYFFRRTAQRINLNCLAILTVQNMKFSSLLIDISTQGASVYHRAHLERGTLIHLDFQLESMKSKASLRANVLTERRSSAGWRYGIGLVCGDSHEKATLKELLSGQSVA